MRPRSASVLSEAWSSRRLKTTRLGSSPLPNEKRRRIFHARPLIFQRLQCLSDRFGPAGLDRRAESFLPRRGMRVQATTGVSNADFTGCV